MKLNIKKILKKSLFITAMSSSFLFFSCQDVIFASIRDEVRLTVAKVSGDITRIARFTADGKEYLYVSNGELWFKDVTQAASGTPTTAENSADYESTWQRTNIPTQRTVAVASDETYLYLLCKTHEIDEDLGEVPPSGYSLYCSTDASEWAAVTLKDADGNDVLSSLGGTGNYDTLKCLFSTNSVKTENRHAFINIAGKVFSLNGESGTLLTENDFGSTYIWLPAPDTPENHTSARGASFMDGKIYLTNHIAMTSNETKDAEADVIYYGSGSNIGYLLSGETTATENDLNLSTIESLAYTNGSIIVGTKSGIRKVSLSENKPNSVTSFADGSNAETALAAYYEVYNVISVDPAKAEGEGDLYATTIFEDTSSSTSATYEGLWAYFPGRNKWNRE